MRQKRTDIVEQAKAIHAAMMVMGRTAPDEVVLSVPTAFDLWATETEYEVGDVRRYNEALYRCQQTHTSQSTWTPDATPALWVVINVAHAGTLEDPIPASRGMEYEYGKHYLDPEDNEIYLCERGSETGTIVLQYLPHELVGSYFTEVE